MNAVLGFVRDLAERNLGSESGAVNAVLGFVRDLSERNC